MNTLKMGRKSNKVSVVIPAGSRDMSAYELLSFNRCLEVLGGYDICIVTPRGMDIDEYTKRWPVKNYSIDNRYFGTVQNHNNLMLKPWFYELFADYEYILIYHLDSYVFRDDLSRWCDYGYDYIGAPWVGCDLKNWVGIKKRNYPKDMRFLHRLTRFRFLHQLGNGGFSLRKTSSMIRNLRFFSLRAKYYRGNEDIFISHYVGMMNPFFKIPDLRTGLEFAFDAHPKLAFEANGMLLPFGCHAWYKNNDAEYKGNPDFWRGHIPMD